MLFDVNKLGQVFTPTAVVEAMLLLRRRQGRILEPACGDGAFFVRLQETGQDVTGIEFDAKHCPDRALNLDFFDYPPQERFSTVIGNPPYVRFQDIAEPTRLKLSNSLFDARSNLYLFFIEKCVRHLEPGGELIFITPRDFLKATSAVRLNQWLFSLGTITDVIELGDAHIFHGALPNCMIWRFELGCLNRAVRYAEVSNTIHWSAALEKICWQPRNLVECSGQLMFVCEDYPLRLSDIAFVKVGGVSGADDIYTDPKLKGPRREFVNSKTVSSGQTRLMLWPEQDRYPPALLPYKSRLINRKVMRFNESNWWHWGRVHHRSDRRRVYVNHKTRAKKPFFTHNCRDYTGAVMAIFPIREDVDVIDLCAALNTVDWAELGFVCNGRFIFNQRSLEQAPLPESFRRFLPN